jgi:hypothetical protein
MWLLCFASDKWHKMSIAAKKERKGKKKKGESMKMTCLLMINKQNKRQNIQDFVPTIR